LGNRKISAEKFIPIIQGKVYYAEKMGPNEPLLSLSLEKFNSLLQYLSDDGEGSPGDLYGGRRRKRKGKTQRRKRKSKAQRRKRKTKSQRI